MISTQLSQVLRTCDDYKLGLLSLCAWVQVAQQPSPCFGIAEISHLRLSAFFAVNLATCVLKKTLTGWLFWAVCNSVVSFVKQSSVAISHQPPPCFVEAVFLLSSHKAWEHTWGSQILCISKNWRLEDQLKSNSFKIEPLNQEFSKHYFLKDVQ